MSNFTKAIQLNQQGCSYLYDKKQYIKAEDCFKKAIQLDSNHPLHHASLALAYTVQGKYVEAEQKFLKAIQLAPKVVQFHHAFGWAYQQQFKYVQARTKYLKCIQMASNVASYHANLAGIYRRQQNYGQAQIENLKAIKLQPNNSSHHNDLAITYYFKKDYVKMGQCLKKAGELSPSSIGYLINYSHFNLIQDNLTGAADLLQKASKKWKQLPAKQAQQYNSHRCSQRSTSYIKQIIYIFDYMKTKTKDLLQNYKHDPLFLTSTNKYFHQYYQPITAFSCAVWNTQKSTNSLYTFQKQRDLVISQIQRKCIKIQKLLNQEYQQGLYKSNNLNKNQNKNQLSLQKLQNYINNKREEITINNGLQFSIKIKLQKEEDLYSYLGNVITELEEKKKENKLLTKELINAKDSYIQLQNVIKKQGNQSDNFSDTKDDSDDDNGYKKGK